MHAYGLEMTLLKESIADYISQIEHQRKRISNLEERSNALSKKEEQLNNQLCDKEELSKIIDANKIKNSSLDDTVAAYAKEIKELNLKLSNIKTEPNTITEEKDKEIKASQAQILLLTDSVTDYTSEIEHQQKHISDVEEGE